MGPSAEDLLEKGNSCLQIGVLDGAFKFYTQCMYVAGSSGVDDSNAAVLVEALSNLSEVGIRRGNYRSAVGDADNALELEPSHWKSLIRKGRALRGFQLHELSLQCLQRAAQLCPGNSSKEIETEIRKAKFFLQQQRTGSYDISAFMSSDLDSKKAPDCADYTGPVEIRSSQDGRGWGLFVTRDVKAGELLLITNPVAASSFKYKTKPGSVLPEQEICTPEESFSECVQQMRTGLPSQKRLMHLLGGAGERYVHQKHTNAVKMEDYQPEWDEDQDAFRVDTDRLRDILRTHAQTPALAPGKSLLGLWLLPAFIKHSCVPNVSQLQVGRALFIFAASRLSAGQEMFFSYVDPLQPLQLRKRSDPDFNCLCKRCETEKQLDNWLESLCKDYEMLIANHSAWCSPEQIIKGYSKIAINLELFLGGLTPKQKQWIRAGYYQAYVYGKGHELKPKEIMWMMQSVCPSQYPRFLEVCRILDRQEDPAVVQVLKEVALAMFGRSGVKKAVADVTRPTDI